MNVLKLRGVAVIAAGLTLGFVGDAAADIERGETVFKKCKACHVVDAPKNRVGPHLVGLFGRAAGEVDGFRYSKAMKASDIVWDEESLDGYLAAPRKYLKGTKMAFAGLRKADDRAALIEYLKSATASK